MLRAFRLITSCESVIRKQTKLPMKQLISTCPGSRHCSQKILFIRHGFADTGVEDIAVMSLIQSPVNLPMVKKIWWAQCNLLLGLFVSHARTICSSGWNQHQFFFMILDLQFHNFIKTNCDWSSIGWVFLFLESRKKLYWITCPNIFKLPGKWWVEE